MKSTSNRYSIVFLLIEGVLKAIKNRLTRSSPIIQPTPMIEACLLVKTNELLMEGLGKAIKKSPDPMLSIAAACMIRA